MGLLPAVCWGPCHPGGRSDMLISSSLRPESADLLRLVFWTLKRVSVLCLGRAGSDLLCVSGKIVTLR